MPLPRPAHDDPRVSFPKYADGARPRRFAELNLKIRQAPLDLAIAIVRAVGDARYTLYERDHRIFIGIGVVWTLEVQRDGHVYCNGRLEEGCAGLAQTLTAATERLPFDNWRAYGRVAFEFADLVHGLEPRRSGGPLLVLSVPSIEMILQDDMLCLRCFDGRQLLQLADLIQRLDGMHPLVPESLPVETANQDSTSRTYLSGVSAAIAEMQAQAYHKVVLSRPVPLSAAVDLPLSFHAGRLSNTPARAFLLRDDCFESYGFCPEMLLEFDAKRMITTQPLAGTRALTGSIDEDRRLSDDLLSDPKEIVEHAVSVRLSMHEMRPLCEHGSLGVTDFMEVCERGSVQHLVSEVRGRLRDDMSAWDALLQLFPAVTVSGIPKRAALHAIRRHEPQSRGLYGGCVFTLDSAGAMDAAVVLRSVFRDGRGCWLQAGAGIVALSSPERELEETREKLDSVQRFLRTLHAA